MPRKNPVNLARDLKARFGLAEGQIVVVGVSAGVDSVVLVRMLREAGLEPIIAHVNYGLRGVESDADEAFVRYLAEELGIPLRVKQSELPVEGNRQEAARNVRYEFFRQVAEEKNAEAVAVAHHQHDQAETVLLNLFRGAGPNGLAGMRPIRPIATDSAIKLIRPLLEWSREEIEGLARERAWDWREDESNTSVTYRRNWIRTRLMPLVQEEFGEGVVARIADSAVRVRAMTETTDTGSSSRLILSELKSVPEAKRHTLYGAALQRFAPSATHGSAALKEIDALLDAQPGRRVEWPGVTIWRERDALVVEPTEKQDRAPCWEIAPRGVSETPLGDLTVTKLADIPADLRTTDEFVEYVDMEALEVPLCIRRWEAGDRFNPLGLGGSKLVSDLLTESKTRPSRRSSQLVLCAGEKIIWAVGYRLAEEARVRPNTRSAARLEWTPVSGS